MTNQQILWAAMEQSARELGCKAEDFLHSRPVVVPYETGRQARKYYKEPISCILASYGNNIVASVKEEYREIVSEFIHKFEFYHCFEMPNLHWLEERLSPLGQRICFMSEYYLPELDRLRPLSCKYQVRLLEAADFAPLYTPEWSNALCRERRELDVLGIGAYDGGRLVGLAGCSADCETMWQIGVDVLPEYRRNGIASALTSRLAAEILERGKIPFYCSAWSNLRSVRNAFKSGFLPAWVEMTVKPAAAVADLNR